VAAEGVAIGAREVIFFKEFEQSRWCNQVLHLSLQSDACTEHYFFMSTQHTTTYNLRRWLSGRKANTQSTLFEPFMIAA
ncbi:MAG TPA: hypothetical protein VF762_20785, partial [Blastocatellia bacterium]